jgi:hypothetical protein
LRTYPATEVFLVTGTMTDGAEADELRSRLHAPFHHLRCAPVEQARSAVFADRR